MWTHPGKKLLFMGGEFAQADEWNYNRSLDWHLLDDPPHRGVRDLVRDLNRLYRELPALHVKDCEADGFEWIDVGNADDSVLSFVRYGEAGDAPVLVVCNFTPVVRTGFRVGVPREGRWAERLNTDAGIYGGSDVGNAGGLTAEPVEWNGRPFSAAMRLPPLATAVFVHQG
jgi:1,4-alpha-glucan branching enzyme